MGCKCKNIIENFQGGQIPLSTTFLSSVSFNSSATFNSSLTANGISKFTGLSYFIGDTSFTGGVTGETMFVKDMTVNDMKVTEDLIVSKKISFSATCASQETTGLTQSVTANSITGIVSLTKEDYTATIAIDTGTYFTVFNSYVKYNSMVMLTVNQPIIPLNANLTASVTNVIDGSFDIKLYNGGVQPIFLSGGVGVNYFVMSDIGPNDKCIKPTPTTRHFSCCTTNDLSTDCSGSTNVILIDQVITGDTKLNVVSESLWEYFSSPSVGTTINLHDGNGNQTCWTYIGEHLGTATTVTYPKAPLFGSTSSCGTCDIPYTRHYSCCDSNISGFTCSASTNVMVIDGSITGYTGDKLLSNMTWESFGSPSGGTVISISTSGTSVSGNTDYICWEYLGHSMSSGTTYTYTTTGTPSTYSTCSACTVSFSGI